MTEDVRAVNAIFGDSYVGSREISIAVNEGRVNHPPITQVRATRLPDEAFKSLCDALFSHGVISQHNSEVSLSQPEYIDLLGTITGPYFKSRQLQPMDPVALYVHVQNENVFRQDINFRDPRELIRHNWFVLQI